MKTIEIKAFATPSIVQVNRFQDPEKAAQGVAEWAGSARVGESISITIIDISEEDGGKN